MGLPTLAMKSMQLVLLSNINACGQACAGAGLITIIATRNNPQPPAEASEQSTVEKGLRTSNMILEELRATTDQATCTGPACRPLRLLKGKGDLQVVLRMS